MYLIDMKWVRENRNHSAEGFKQEICQINLTLGGVLSSKKLARGVAYFVGAHGRAPLLHFNKKGASPAKTRLALNKNLLRF